jgi:hypothetical protein
VRWLALQLLEAARRRERALSQRLEARTRSHIHGLTHGATTAARGTNKQTKQAPVSAPTPNAHNGCAGLLQEEAAARAHDADEAARQLERARVAHAALSARADGLDADHTALKAQLAAAEARERALRKQAEDQGGAQAEREEDAR